MCVCVCSDTVSRSGMFCAIATTIERCKTEGVVDVFQVVKALRVHKPGAVCTLVSSIITHFIHFVLTPLQRQYESIFDVVLTYLDSFDIYANFGK